MQLEFHQLDHRWEHLRVRQPHRQRSLLASLADSGQQTPIVAVLSTDNPPRYLVIDGYKRIAALKQLGGDTVEAVIWPMSEAEALLLDRTLRFSQQETALEQGWLLSELGQHFGYSFDELARRFDRSISWVSRRLALVELLPEAIQQQVREGKIAPQLAMKYLAPVARISLDDCQRMGAAFATHRCSTREAGQLYTAWRQGSRQARERILAAPELFLKTQRQPPAPTATEAAALARDLDMAATILQRANRRLNVALTEMNGERLEQAQQKIGQTRRDLDRMAQRIKKEQEEKHAEPTATQGDCGVECTESEQAGDWAPAECVAAERAQSAAFELHRSSAHSTGGESRTAPPTDPRTVGPVQGQSCAGP
jgi:ParB/RepB/Spo0J family partition protein